MKRGASAEIQSGTNITAYLDEDTILPGEQAPAAAQPAPAPYDSQKRVLYKVGRGWSRLTSRTTPTAVDQPSVLCSSC